jgi:hypothetical protein
MAGGTSFPAITNQYGLLSSRFVHCSLERMPRQGGAFDAGRIISHAYERRQVAEVNLGQLPVMQTQRRWRIPRSR